MSDRNERVTENLRLQLEILKMMRIRQLTWADATDDAVTAQIHSEAAELIEKTVQQFNGLLDRYDVPAQQAMLTKSSTSQSPA